jgi:hydrogenase nickel incorporation protein HypB
MPPARAGQATLRLETDILAKNNRLAAEVRARLAARGVLALNLMSSPGSGKTTLLTRTLTDLRRREPDLPCHVVEGDQATSLDAERIRATGARVVQINTGAGCHLDAAMLHDALTHLAPPPGAIVFVENVGNLVCPALFDLGETRRVVLSSVTEGDDKPLKYPHMFRTADLLLLTKTDLLPYVNFDVDQWATHARRVNPRVRLLPVSATHGDGLTDWYTWLRDTPSHPNGPSPAHDHHATPPAGTSHDTPRRHSHPNTTTPT